MQGAIETLTPELCASYHRALLNSHSQAGNVTPQLINELIAADLQAVDEVIRERLDSEVVLVRQVADYIIGGGGKRLRPTLVILAAGACGYAGRHHLQLAAVVEFIHTATLLHDDVVDDSQMRRGRSTANSAFGDAAAVLVGDFLYSRAFQMMVQVQSMRVMEVLADATNTIAEGEVMQLLHVHNADVTETDYLRVIRSKTAKLFEAAGRLGGILAGVARTRKMRWRSMACTWARHSSWWTTFSTIRAISRRPGRIWAMTCPRARPRCRSFAPCATAAPSRAHSSARPLSRAG